MPGSNETVRDEMREFISEIYDQRSLDDGSVMLVPSILLPNSDWYDKAKQFGFEITNEDEYVKNYIEHQGDVQTSEELTAEYEILREKAKGDGVLY